jgi:hypothetical protein
MWSRRLLPSGALGKRTDSRSRGSARVPRARWNPIRRSDLSTVTSLGTVQRGPANRPHHAVINGENFHALQLLVYLYEADRWTVSISICPATQARRTIATSTRMTRGATANGCR